ncbi:MAG: VWA-like domain-containing protein [Oscillibacter sp.]|jgi:predicted metal-dependent peptidase|nr:VWA-like domain-containing protein [Oscillibacter sp.]
MAEKPDVFLQADKLAREVLTLSRNTLLVNLRFLDMALSRFTLKPYPGTMATDGQYLFYDAFHVLSSYKSEKERVTRDYLHIVLHCVFHHLFIGDGIDRRRWDTACDIAVESVLCGLDLPCIACRRQRDQAEPLQELQGEVGQLSAEKIYRWLLDKHFTDEEVAHLRDPFLSDDHRSWYLPTKEDGEEGEGRDEGSAQHDSRRNLKKQKEQRRGGTGRKNDSNQGQHTRSQKPEEVWKDVSRRLQVDLETLSLQQGTAFKSLVESLLNVNREHYDYGEFLRRFTTMGEVLQVNDDEFDYIFYTYGLQLYQNMPLVEPLEYQEVRRIKEFVVAIDTSGSVSGPLVQSFIIKTYNILKQQESFFTKINLHIIQCDAKIQEDHKITSQQEFDDYLDTMELKGFGGTDFRPVFSYVDKLIDSGEFTNLKGLIYFTDGIGTFPAAQPRYDAAFVFVSDDYLEPKVPVWAIKLILKSEEI